MNDTLMDEQSIIGTMIAERLNAQTSTTSKGRIERIKYLDGLLENSKLSQDAICEIRRTRDSLEQLEIKDAKQATEPKSADVPEEPAEPSLQLVFHTCQRLGRVFNSSLDAGQAGGFKDRIAGMAATLQKAVAQDRSAALAAAYLDVQTTYFVQHHVQAALLTEVLGISAGLPAEERLPLICGALTLDLGLIDVHQQLESQIKISEQLRAAIQLHPQKGHAKCVELGVDDDVWLDVMLCHHERLDGSGYPRQLKEDQLSVGMRVVAIADSYSAMIRHRPYRKAFNGKDALREMYLMKGKLDIGLIQLLVRGLSLYPPGSIVRLAEGEVGVVVRSTNNALCPVVYSFLNRGGMPMADPQRRDVGLPKYAIKNIEPLANYKLNITGLLKLWK